MANADVQVKEVQLLEAYSTTYKDFMDATIAATHRFRNLFERQRSETDRQVSRIQNAKNEIRTKMEWAKNELEASQKRNRDDGGEELRHRQQAYEKFKNLYKKAQQYEESGKKLQQRVYREIERMDQMTLRMRHKMETNKEEGENFLKKAISAINSYKQ